MDWVQGQVKVAKKVKTPPFAAVPHRTPNQKRKPFFFAILSRRLAESEDGLDSSLAQSGGEFPLCKLAPKFWRARDSKG